MLDTPVNRSSSALAVTRRHAVAAPTKATTVGSYLGQRLSQIGLKHHFAVAGD